MCVCLQRGEVAHTHIDKMEIEGEDREWMMERKNVQVTDAVVSYCGWKLKWRKEKLQCS